ncbi:radical SAM family heme chaperone HemW [Mobiluncus mulieris]|uniref:radical SAM family heme chaperone HemW n=1 Tax=Mobiluncus mulieris TaxID=2052 RepID=UPI00146FEF60|nr:coproporphyrinogen III oxidase [Mobiluncus mulieris]
MSFSAYVHVPYCLRRCGYCDFNTYANLGLGPGVAGYADAVGREILLVARLFSGRLGSVHEVPAEMAPHATGATPTTRGTDPSETYEIPGGRAIDTVFFGGGTPTVLPPEDLVQIFYALKDAFGVCPGAEVTTEANPDTVDAGYLEELAAGGFTRVSFGMQSAVSGVLRVLDRTHTQANLEAAVRAAQSLGLECSVDLIYGTPGESVADWRESLEAALALGVSHVSCYALSIEPATALGRELRQGKITPVDPDDQAEKYEIADDLLSAAGLQWYEISNWARPGHECRHNLAYWRNRDYYGFGPGAHSHLRSRRFWNLKHPVAWDNAVKAGRLPVADSETVTGESLELEELLLGLRLREGLDLREYAQKFGQAPHELELAARKLAVEGLVEPEKLPRAVLTRRGRLLADTVIQRLAGV